MSESVCVEMRHFSMKHSAWVGIGGCKVTKKTTGVGGCWLTGVLQQVGQGNKIPENREGG